MQYFVKQRATETGDVTFETPAIDVEGMPLLVFELVTYELNGGGSYTAQLQTSNDLETWSDVTGSSATGAAVGSAFADAHITSRPYGKYVRFQLAMSSVTSLSYSLVLNTYHSS